MKSLLSKLVKAARAVVTRRLVIESDAIPFEFENVPLRKLLNWLLVEASVYVKPDRPWGWPTHLQIEPSSLCNLRCTLCPVTTGLDRQGPPGNMDIEQYKRLLDEIGDYLFLIIMWDWGEPFVNPNIYDMIAYAENKGISVVSSSNGHAFARQENARRLVETGIDSIIVAVDGVDQESYEHYRQGGRLDTVLQGIRNLVAEKAALASTTPLINMRTVVSSRNESQIPQLIELGKSLGVDVVSFKTLNPHYEAAGTRDVEAEKEFRNKFLPKNGRYLRFEYAGEGLERIKRIPPCKNLWIIATIHQDGKVISCTFDHDETIPLGDLNQSSFRDVWTGESYRRLRHQFRRDWQQIQICRDCSYAYVGGSCENETMAEVYYGPRVAHLFAQSEKPDLVRPFDEAEGNISS